MSVLYEQERGYTNLESFPTRQLMCKGSDGLIIGLKWTPSFRAFVYLCNHSLMGSQQVRDRVAGQSGEPQCVDADCCCSRQKDESEG